MSAFEYVFAFYSLILGLAAAEVVSGFADMWRDRRRIEVGFCTPVLALCVLLGIMNTWITFWAYREILAVGAEFMLVTALTALPYVFIARLMFPREGQGVSLEEHFFDHRRFMLIGVAAPVIVGRVWALVDGRGYPGGFEGAYFAIRILIPLALLFTANRRANRVGLALIPLVQLAGLFR
ncbi:MAG: hypothetical protein K2X07_11910 [Caulobacteraceae bacterium]|nr:hypothetical protein [Caulobacteraceae bacterium]